MQKLSKDEMKKVMGGQVAPPVPGCGLSCNPKQDSCPQVNRGTCSETCTDKDNNTWDVCSG
jgi:hypothetical protein